MQQYTGFKILREANSVHVICDDFIPTFHIRWVFVSSLLCTAPSWRIDSGQCAAVSSQHFSHTQQTSVCLKHTHFTGHILATPRVQHFRKRIIGFGDSVDIFKRDTHSFSDRRIPKMAINDRNHWAPGCLNGNEARDYVCHYLGVQRVFSQNEICKRKMAKDNRILMRAFFNLGIGNRNVFFLFVDLPL